MTAQIELHKPKKSIRERSMKLASPARLKTMLLSTLMILISGVMVLPVFFMITMSLRTRKEIMLEPLGMPASLNFDNYSAVYEGMNYLQSMGNTIGVTLATIALTAVIASLAAYPLARARGKISTVLYNFFIIGMIIPPFAALTPLYLFMRDLHLLNSHVGLVLVYTVANLPLGVFFYTSFMKAIPMELEEAAHLDGATNWQTYWRIIFPMLKPITGTLALFITLTVWNDIVNPMLFLTDESKFTIMTSVIRFLGTYAVDPTQLFPAATMASLPLLFFFLLLSKQIVAGMTAGAVKS
jgi:raffinose/stachyose/melibiose transport system permease protein